jgi:tyrosine-protein kinase Etk/Wzc
MFESSTISRFAKWYGASASASSWALDNARLGHGRASIAPASDQSLALATSLQLRSGASSVIVFAATEAQDSVVSLVAGLGHALVELGAGEVLMLDSSERPAGGSASGQSGIDQFVSRELPLDELLEEVLPGLYVLSADGRTSNSFRMSGESAKAFFKQLRQRFRYVLVAAPPYAKDSKARQLAKYSDGIVLTLQRGHQGRTRLLQIQRELKADRLVSLGFVLAVGSAK